MELLEVEHGESPGQAGLARRFRNPTIICVTDTNDLDNQLSETFDRQAHLAPAVVRAERIQPAEGDRRRSLYELLDVPAGRHRLHADPEVQSGQGRGPIPVLSERDNAVVIADEAHRSQYEGLARNLLKALPNATRFGFTGTPIESTDRSTQAAFGRLHLRLPDGSGARRTARPSRSTTSRARCPSTSTSSSSRSSHSATVPSPT